MYAMHPEHISYVNVCYPIADADLQRTYSVLPDAEPTVSDLQRELKLARLKIERLELEAELRRLDRKMNEIDDEFCLLLSKNKISGLSEDSGSENLPTATVISSNDDGLYPVLSRNDANCAAANVANDDAINPGPSTQNCYVELAALPVKAQDPQDSKLEEHDAPDQCRYADECPNSDDTIPDAVTTTELVSMYCIPDAALLLMSDMRWPNDDAVATSNPSEYAVLTPRRMLSLNGNPSAVKAEYNSHALRERWKNKEHPGYIPWEWWLEGYTECQTICQQWTVSIEYDAGIVIMRGEC